MSFPARLLADLCQSGEQHFSILVILHDVLPPIPACRDMIKGIWILNAELPVIDREPSGQLHLSRIDSCPFHAGPFMQ